MNMYCIRDLVAGYSMTPVCSETDMTFMRLVRGELDNAQSNSNIVKFPQDFALVFIGAWDAEAGVLTGTSEPRTLGKVSDLVPPSLPNIQSIEAPPAVGV